MLSRREFVAGSAAGLAGATPPARPNIVFIYTDDQRWDAMGCAGHPFLKTPNMDRIAREGALFRNAFVTTPLCSPSRASFLTGRCVHAHGVTGNGDNAALSHRLVTWPRLLHDAGYDTAFVGKWHMGTDDTPRPGFDRWVSFRGQGVYENPPLNIDGTRVQAQGYMTDILAGHAVEFLKRKRSRPFALYFGHKAVHGPFTPAERHKGMYSSDPIPRRPNTADSLDGKPALTRKVGDEPAFRPRTQFSDDLVRNQLRALMAVDESIGGVFKALEETGQLDNTLMVFASDNGYFWGEHSLGDKRWAYEESIRIPLVMRYPKLIRAGSTIDAAALNIDIAPTMLELGGAKTPPDVHGRSLVPVLGGKTGNWRRGFLAEYFAERNFPRVPSWHGVRTTEWKYVHYTDLEGADELYNLKADPYELKNVIGDAAAQPVLKDLKAELARLLKETA